MSAEERRRVIEHREWVLTGPTREDAVEEAILAARTAWDRDGRSAGRRLRGGVGVWAEDGQIVIGYTLEQDGRYADQRRKDADVLQNVMRLAVAWSFRDHGDWLEAADALKSVLDGGEAILEPGDIVPADLTGDCVG